jgi:hypothetical protein
MGPFSVAASLPLSRRGLDPSAAATEMDEILADMVTQAAGATLTELGEGEMCDLAPFSPLPHLGLPLTQPLARGDLIGLAP